MGFTGLGFKVWKDGKMKTTIMGYTGTTMRIHSLIPS